MHRAAAVACLVAGVWVLAGPGWALLLLGVALWGMAPRQQQPVRMDDVRAAVKAWAGRVWQAPRRAAAVGTMAVSAVALPSGVLLVAGVGAGVIAAGVVLGGVSLLTGWNA